MRLNEQSGPFGYRRKYDMTQRLKPRQEPSFSREQHRKRAAITDRTITASRFQWPSGLNPSRNRIIKNNTSSPGHVNTVAWAVLFSLTCERQQTQTLEPFLQEAATATAAGAVCILFRCRCPQPIRSRRSCHFVGDLRAAFSLVHILRRKKRADLEVKCSTSTRKVCQLKKAC